MFIARPFVGACLVLAWHSSNASAQSVFAGKAFADTSFKTLAGVQIEIVELSQVATTSAGGSFRFAAVPKGDYTVRASLAGYARYEVPITLSGADRLESAIILPRLAKGDTEQVVGEAGAPIGFYERARGGHGQFLTRANLESAGLRFVGDVFRDVMGAAVTGSRNGLGVVFRSRAAYQSMGSIGTGCFARIFLDKLLITAWPDAEPVDLNSIAAVEVEAVEYYASPFWTPFEYSRGDLHCGIVVLHTRR